jgi:hypothetical protein
VTPKSPEYTLSVIYNNFRLKVVDNVRFLGMELDCQLNWKQYTEKYLKKLNMACFIIWKLQALVSEQILLMIYFSYSQSQREYGIIIWGSSLVMRTLLLAQKRVIRVLLRLGPRYSCREGFKRLGILTVPSLYIYPMLMSVKNHKFHLTNNSIHLINTRESGTLHVSSVRLSSVKRGVLYSSIMAFNKLPQNIPQMSNNVNIFKSMMKKFSCRKCFLFIGWIYFC